MSLIYEPVLDGVERLVIRDVVHENETHCTSVVRCCDCPVSLLTRRVLSHNTHGSACRQQVLHCPGALVFSGGALKRRDQLRGETEPRHYTAPRHGLETEASRLRPHPTSTSFRGLM